MKFKIRNVFFFACILGTGAMLLHVSQKVQVAEIQKKALQEKIVHEQHTIKVLRTEWAFLNNPERLEMLAQKYLDIEPVTTVQLATSAQDYFQDPSLILPEEMPTTASAPVSPAEPAAGIVPVSASPQNNFDQLIQKVSTGGER